MLLLLLEKSKKRYKTNENVSKMPKMNRPDKNKNGPLQSSKQLHTKSKDEQKNYSGKNRSANDRQKKPNKDTNNRYNNRIL